MPSVRNIGVALPPRLRWYVLATIAVGVPVVVAAALAAARSAPSARTAVGVATFFCLAILAEWRPVPIDVEGKRLVSLAFVFIISSQLLFGWEWSTLIGALGIGLAMTIDRSEPIKVAFNSAAYALAAGLAALPLLIDGNGRTTYGLVALSVVVRGRSSSSPTCSSSAPRSGSRRGRRSERSSATTCSSRARSSVSRCSSRRRR